MFNLLNNIISSQHGIIWGIRFILTILALKSQAAEIPVKDATPQTALEHFLGASNSGYIVYGIDTFETYTFVTPLEEVEENEFNGINDACEAIPNLHKNCKNHPASCQSVEFSLSNLEETIVQRSHSLFNLQRVCEPQEHPPSKTIISRCNQGIA